LILPERYDFSGLIFTGKHFQFENFAWEMWKPSISLYSISYYVRDVRRHRQNKAFSPAPIQWIKTAALNEDQKSFVFPK